MAEILDSETGQFESRAKAEESASSPVAVWMEAIELAGKTEKEWRDDVKTAIDVFRGKEGEQGTAFNLYHSNIQTIVPAIYNSTPIPDIRPRFPSEDPIPRQGADVIERSLNHSIDEYDFDGVMECGAFDLSLPGRGVVKVNYNPVTGVVGNDPVTGEPVEDIVYQSVNCAHVPWAAYRQGPGRSFADIPWQAFAGYYTREALLKLSPEHGAKVQLDMQLESEKEGAAGDKPAKDIFKRALVWEVWDKENRKVLFVAPSYRDAILAEVDDPLELENFFPTPPPMYGTRVPGDLTPICEYTIYKRLLTELDDLTRRITALIKQLRVRALYAGKSSEVADWAQGADGDVIEAADAVGFLQSGGLEKALAWWPLDPTVKALESLYAQRDQVKNSIYEVTGMSDIVRGESDPNETATAQEIKNKWGAIRIRQRQKEVQRFARDLLRIKAEIICNKFTPQMLTQICGYQIDPQVFEIFKNDKLRSYRIDIETDSTIQGDLQFNQGQMSQFVESTGSYFNNMSGAVQLGLVPPKTVTTIYGAFARNFNLGKQVEDELEQAVQFAAQQPTPQQQQQQQMQAEANQAAQEEKAKADVEAQKVAEKQAADQKKAEEDAIKAQRDHDMALEKERTRQVEIAEKLAAGKREDERHTEDMELRRQELGFQRSMARNQAFGKAMEGKMAQSPDDEQNLEAGPFDQVMAALNQVAKLLVQSAQAQAQQTEALASELAEMKQIMVAPAEIVRDAQGRVASARKVLPNRTIN